MANIAKNIRLLRTAQKMTQDQLAESLHVTRQTVSNYETGKSQPDIDTIVRLAEALQADPNTLIYGIPTLPARKREYVKTAIAVVLAILAVVVLRQEPQLRELSSDTFNPYLLFAYTSFFKRFAYLVLGFAVMQVLSLCFGLQPQEHKPVLLGYTGLSDALLEKYVADSHHLWAESDEPLTRCIIGSVIGTHAGPGAVAVAFFRKEN